MQSFRGSWPATAWQLMIWGCLGLSSVCLSNSWVRAQETPTVVAPAWRGSDTAALNRIAETQSKLNSKVTFDFQGLPLISALNSLGEQAGVSFTVNEAELDSLGVTSDTPVTAANQSVTLEEALSQILQPLDLSIVVYESDIEVSSNDDVENHPVVRVYDLSLAFRAPVNVGELVFKLSQFVEPDQWRDFGGTGNSTIVPFGSSLVVAAPLSTQRGLVKALRSVANTHSFMQSSEAGNDSWKPAKAFSLSFNPNPTATPDANAQKLNPGTIVLPKGTNYDLVRITQQPANAKPNSEAVGWMKTEAPLPAWLADQDDMVDTSEPLRQKLRQAITVDWQGIPLNVALADVFKRLEIAYWINDTELDTVGIPADTPVTFKASNTSAQVVLQRMLRVLDLSYRIGANSIEVTSTDHAGRALNTRFYDLSVLRNKPFDMQAMLMVISQTVAPDEWRDFGGTGDSSLVPFGSKLSVTATDPTIAEIEAVLCQLATMHPDNLPSPNPGQHIKIDTILSGIPGGSTIKIPTDGIYQIRPQ